MLQTTLLGTSLKRGWTDPIHDSDFLLVHLDFLHQGPNNFASRLPTWLLELLRNAAGELLQLTDHQPEFVLLGTYSGDTIPISGAAQVWAGLRHSRPRMDTATFGDANTAVVG